MITAGASVASKACGTWKPHCTCKPCWGWCFSKSVIQNRPALVAALTGSLWQHSMAHVCMLLFCAHHTVMGPARTCPSKPQHWRENARATSDHSEGAIRLA